ncbi:MAG: hypothetical protein Kow0026_00940 [Oricola sp.]
MKLFDFNDPFYRPLWIRIAVVAIPALWGVFELAAGSPFWGILFCGAAALAFYGLFITYEPREPATDRNDEE